MGDPNKTVTIAVGGGVLQYDQCHEQDVLDGTIWGEQHQHGSKPFSIPITIGGPAAFRCRRR
jgi:hypothetical protein